MICLAYRDCEINEGRDEGDLQEGITKLLDESADLKVLGLIWDSRLGNEVEPREKLSVRDIVKQAEVVGNVSSRYTYGIDKIYITLREGKLPLGSYVFVLDGGLPIVYRRGVHALELSKELNGSGMRSQVHHVPLPA